MRDQGMGWVRWVVGTLLLGLGSACSTEPPAEVAAQGNEAIVLGSDSRKNYYEASGTEQGWLDATALVMPFSSITDEGSFESTSPVDMQFCSGERFEGEFGIDQSGSAFLIDSDTMISAAHVHPCETEPACDPETDPNACYTQTIVFGFNRFQEDTVFNSFGEPTYTETSSAERYRCDEIQVLDPTRDVIIFKLDRPVPDVSPLSLAEGSPAVGASIKVAGHGQGLAGKVVSGTVKERLRNGSVRTTLDAGHGDSGAPVLNSSGEVVGFVTHGPWRFNTLTERTLAGACRRWNTCPVDTGCPPEEPECIGTDAEGNACGLRPPVQPFHEPFPIFLSVEEIGLAIVRDGFPATGPRGFDFNGDGFEDVAVGAPQDDDERKGLVGILMGGGPLDGDRLSELFPGIDFSWALGPLPSLKVYGDGVWNVDLQTDERFGATFWWGNFDEDAADELIVDTLTTHNLRVLNHDGAGDLVLDETDIPGLIRHVLTVGDFNGDGYDDVAVGLTGSRVGVIYSRLGTGLAGGVAEMKTLTLPSPGPYTLVAGDFDCNGFEDLAVGMGRRTGETALIYAGGVDIFYGSSGGLPTSGTPQEITPSDLPQPPGEATGYLGHDLAAGNLNGDVNFNNGSQCVDLIASAWYGDGLANVTGSVNIFYGSTEGVLLAGSQHFWTGSLPPTAGDIGTTHSDTDFSFGQSMSVADYNQDGISDLYVTSPHGGDGGHGALRVFLGGVDGVTVGSLHNCTEIVGTFPPNLCAFSGNEVNHVGGPSRGAIFVGGNTAFVNEFWNPLTLSWEGNESRAGIASLLCPEGDLVCQAGDFALTGGFLVSGMLGALKDLNDPATQALLFWLQTGIAGLGVPTLHNVDYADFGAAFTRPRPESRRPFSPGGAFYLNDDDPLTRLAPTRSDPDGDTDGDGVVNGSDNCPQQANPDQKDSDGDGAGDVCQCGAASGPPVEQDLQVFLTPRGSATDNQVRLELQIQNQGAFPVNLETVTIRYWYSNEGTRLQQFFVDGSPFGSTTITGTFVRTPIEYTNANSYVDIRFQGSGAVLDAGATSGPLKVRFARSDFTNYNEADDFSRLGMTSEVKSLAPGVELLQSGIRVWGRAPVPRYCSGGPLSLGTQLTVEYMPGPGDNPSDQQLRPHFRLVNTGSTDIKLSDVVVRYYFTGANGTYNTFFDYVAMGPGASGSVLPLSPTKPLANRYLELRFATSLGMLVAGANTGRIETRVSRSDFATLVETDDYSYKAGSALAPQAKAVALVAGTLKWGTPP